jgi:hypothetical protein
VAPEAFLDELRLRGSLGAAWRAGLTRALAVEQARLLGPKPGEDAPRATAEAPRKERGLSPEGFERWQAEQQVENLERLLRDESHVGWVETLLEPEVLRHLTNHLRLTGDYAGLLERARDKERVLTAAGLEVPRPEDAGITEDMVWSWYFEERQSQRVPASLDQAAREDGFTDAEALRRAALRELCYVLAKAEAPE